ncbi:MAG: serine hydrolase [Bacteroidia bacterium]|nr:serine hydrolase [Bacteroidia bacterium]
MNPAKTSILILFSLIGMLSIQLAFGQSLEQDLPKEVVEAIEKRVEKAYTPSVAIAIIDSSGVRYYNFGKAAVVGPKVNENTIYEIGSISKVFTAILLAQQVLDGDLKLDNPINDYLPENAQVPVMGKKEITFGNLTDHTSGLPRMPGNFTPANPYNPFADYSIEQLYEFISTYTPTRKVGDAYEYSNLAQGLLGHILAKNKEMSYEDLMVKIIADPLQMANTRITFTEDMKKHLALGHSAGSVVANWDIPTLAGAGAIRSSTSDMAKFISANLGYVESPLYEAMKLSHEKRHNKAGKMSVAMGWHIKKGKEGNVIWHNGGTGGYRTFTGFVKETGKGVVLLTNSSQGSDDLGFRILDSESELAKIKFTDDAVDVSESILESYVGDYELIPQFHIRVTREGKRLFAQATGQQKFEIYPESETDFFYTAVKAKIRFKVEDGKVESLTLFQGGREMPGKKVE